MGKSDEGQPCVVTDCPVPIGRHSAKGMCPGHYQRLKRYGDPTFSPGPSGIKPTPLAVRFWSKVERRGPDDCWLWTGHVKRNGYGAIGRGGKSSKIEMAHRVAWELTHGAIPADKVIDHRCHTRACVNPRHLQVVTPHENMHNMQGANSRSKSGVRGVHAAAYGRWIVRVYTNGKTHHGGSFATVAEAEKAAIALRNRLMTNNLVDRRAAH